MAQTKKKSRKSAPKRAAKRKPRAKRPRLEQGRFLLGLIIIALLTTGLYVGGTHLLVKKSTPPVTNQVIRKVTPKPTATPIPAGWAQVSEYRIPILMYHHIRSLPDRDMMARALSVNPETFARQLDYLSAHGYTTVTFEQVQKGILPSKPVILTFDDSYKDAYSAAFPALQQRGMTGVFYVISGLVGNADSVSWDQLREMQKTGMEIGAHTISHPELPKLSVTDQKDQIDTSIRDISTQIGVPIISFAYPSGKSNTDTVNLVQAAGITYAVTTDFGVATGAMNQELLPRLRVTNATIFDELLP
ncbi:polysaccharide deacetylase family protein [Patescibacteria group bacterium]|nr:polysaccharide deacetylase family protein [Patescibacteria group bacterium]